MGGLRRRFFILCIALALVGCGTSVEDIEETTKADVQSYLRTDGKLAPYGLTVLSVDLVNSSGNEYTGFAKIQTRSYETHQVPITVVHDGDEGMWQIERGGFLFLMNEPSSGSSP